jgi:catechol 2,3-dioxygenase-like lactoylglutathione lyase family enzyme
MKRFHVHIAVDDLDANIRFYSQVFGAPPTVHKADYRSG